jgi:hypothetical protein
VNTRFLASSAFLIGIGLAGAMPALADVVPCDTLRDYLRDFAARNPQAAEDTGGTEFLARAMDLREWPSGDRDHASLTRMPGDGCNGALARVPDVALDLALRASLDNLESGVCALSVDLYDARPFGGFIVLANEQGTMHCAGAQVVLIDAGKPRLGPGLLNEGGRICGGSTFHVVREGDRAFPAVLDRNIEGKDLAYVFSLFSPDGGEMSIDQPLCRVSVTYRAEFYVADWLGPHGKDDVDPALRAAIEPILLARAAGGDAPATAGAPLDHPEGDSKYDTFLRAHPAAPIVVTEADGAGWSPPYAVFFSDQINNPYSQLDGDLTPLRVGGRRLLLVYGTAFFGWRTSPDPAFALLEWDGAGLQRIAAGYMAKRGRDPAIE